MLRQVSLRTAGLAASAAYLVTALPLLVQSLEPQHPSIDIVANIVVGVSVTVLFSISHLKLWHTLVRGNVSLKDAVWMSGWIALLAAAMALHSSAAALETIVKRGNRCARLFQCLPVCC